MKNRGASAPGGVILSGTARLVGDLAELFLPGCCAGCGERLTSDRRRSLVCVRCLLALRPPPPPLCVRCGLPLGSRPGSRDACEECGEWPVVLRLARSASVLRPPSDRLVHGLKYGGWRRLGEVMAERMARLDPGESHVIVPVPTTRTRRRRRGYNQAAVLAEALEHRLDRPVVRALRRRSGSRTQVALQPSERGRNVRRAFSVRAEHASRLRGARVLLVDDVLTTGATACAAAGALEKAGVMGVTLLTFARALPYRDRRARRTG